MEISAAEFKAKCLKIMDEIARTRKPIVITKRGKPVAKLVPAELTPRKPAGSYVRPPKTEQFYVPNYY